VRRQVGREICGPLFIFAINFATNVFSWRKSPQEQFDNIYRPAELAGARLSPLIHKIKLPVGFKTEMGYVASHHFLFRNRYFNSLILKGIFSAFQMGKLMKPA
jgi:hypothetical protein